jgi:hypothetical protein
VNLPGIDGLPPAPGADDQRALIKRARREALRWVFRSVLLAVIAGLALARGWIIFGVIFAALGVMGLQLARSTRRRAAELAQKLKLLEAK